MGEGWVETDAVDRGRIVEETLAVDNRDDMDSVLRRKGRCLSVSDSPNSSCKAAIQKLVTLN